MADEGQPLSFTVSLSEASTVPITVDVSTAGGSAIANQEYSPSSQTITFAPSETSQTIVLATTDDTIVEGNETVEVLMS